MLSALTGRASAPANIAIIKYMGKVDPQHNLPSNPSLSLTMSQARSFTEVRHFPDSSDSQDRVRLASSSVSLNSTGQKRVITHVRCIENQGAALLSRWGLSPVIGGHYRVETRNDFPMGVGMASSASGFAALTLAALGAICELKDQKRMRMLFSENSAFREEVARLSRQGSGSSCRSFFGPWVSWSGEKVTPLSSPLVSLQSRVFLCQQDEKRVSSTEAHRRVQTSSKWSMRSGQVKRRFEFCRQAVEQGDWDRLVDLGWEEFMEMHELFHASAPPFSYWNKQTRQVLQGLETSWPRFSVKPLITMDAGANVHVIYPGDLEADPGWKRLRGEVDSIEVFEDKTGEGAQML